LLDSLLQEVFRFDFRHEPWQHGRNIQKSRQDVEDLEKGGG